MYDVIIIGAGPAGVSASLYTKRANKKTLILYSEQSSLEKTEKIENYYGFENGISGEDLYNVGINQARNIGVDVVKQEVVKIEIENQSFKVTTNEKVYDAKSIIISVGAKKNMPKIKGIEEFEGKGVSYCAICDGFFYKNKDVSVIGNGNYSVSETNDLINVVNKVTILTNGEQAPEIRADNVDIITKNIKEIIGENRVREVRFEDDSVIKTDGIFVAQGSAGTVELAKKLGIIMENNNIIVDDRMQTNIKGIFACGDCIGGWLQISKAVYEGAKAGISVIEYLKS